jgi:hypothetical protein
MNVIARRFIADLRTHCFLEPLQPDDPGWIEVVEADEALLKHIYEQGIDDPEAIERMDQITDALRPEAGTLRERHASLVELTKDWKF